MENTTRYTSKYNSQIQKYETNIRDWETFVNSVNNTLTNQVNLINNLQEQINQNNITIEALINRVEALEADTSTLKKYVRSSDESVNVLTDNLYKYSQSFVIYSNEPTVYVFSNKTLDDNIKINGNLIKRTVSSDGQVPFYTFNANTNGNVMKITTENTALTDFELTFATGEHIDSNDASCKVRVKVKYPGVTNIQNASSLTGVNLM